MFISTSTLVLIVSLSICVGAFLGLILCKLITNRLHAGDLIVVQDEEDGETYFALGLTKDLESIMWRDEITLNVNLTRK